MVDGRNLLNCAVNLDCVACLREGCYLVGIRTTNGYTEVCLRPDLLYSTSGEIDIVIQNESVCGGDGVSLGGSIFVNPSTPKTPDGDGLFDGTGLLLLVISLAVLLSTILVLLLGWCLVKRRMRASLPGV